MYLLDTNVVSELRRPRPDGAVLAWLASVKPAKLCLSVVTLGEIQTGAERVRLQDPAKAQEIEAWADTALGAFEVLPIDAAIIRQWARLRRGRRDENFEDNILGVTAVLHRLVLVTRNVRDFDDFDVEIVNPLQFSGA
jgi:predicted nucleic acid-binding protein